MDYLNSLVFIFLVLFGGNVIIFGLLTFTFQSLISPIIEEEDYKRLSSDPAISGFLWWIIPRGQVKLSDKSIAALNESITYKFYCFQQRMVKWVMLFFILAIVAYSFSKN